MNGTNNERIDLVITYERRKLSRRPVRRATVSSIWILALICAAKTYRSLVSHYTDSNPNLLVFDPLNADSSEDSEYLGRPTTMNHAAAADHNKNNGMDETDVQAKSNPSFLTHQHRRGSLSNNNYNSGFVVNSLSKSEICSGRSKPSSLNLSFSKPSKWTIVMSTNYDFVEFFENWWIHYEQLNIDANLIVMTEDDDAYEALTNMKLSRVAIIRADCNISNRQQSTFAIDEAENISTFNSLAAYHNHNKNNSSISSSSSSKGLSFGSQSYKKLVTERPTRLLSVMCSPQLATDYLIYADVDSVWMKNPIPYIQSYFLPESNNYSNEITPTTPSSTTTTTTNSKINTTTNNTNMDLVAQIDNPNLKPVGYCTGFLAMKRNDKTLQLLAAWEDTIKEKWISGDIDQAGDQPIFWHVISSAAMSKLGLRHAGLPISFFPPGRLYFDLRTTAQQRAQAIVVHNNWIVGHRNKKVRFYIWDLWKVPEDTTTGWWESAEANVTTIDKLLKVYVRLNLHPSDKRKEKKSSAAEEERS